MTTNVGEDSWLYAELARDGSWTAQLKSASASVDELSRLREQGFCELYRCGESMEFLLHMEWIMKGDKIVGLGFTHVCDTEQTEGLHGAFPLTHVDQYSYAVLFDTPRGMPQYSIFPDIVGPDVILESPEGVLVSWFDVSRLSPAHKQSLKHRLVVRGFAE